jgi:hypothetical protein
MSLTKLSLAGNNFITPGQAEFGKLHLGWRGKPLAFFYSVVGELGQFFASQAGSGGGESSY